MHDQRSKSPGPKTPAGKRKSSKNSTTHGCLSSEKILPGESQDEYDALWQEWLDKYEPADNLDLDLLRQLVDCAWRLRRSERTLTQVEAALLAQNLDASQWTGEDVKRLQLMQRYRTTAENSFHRALRLVQHLAKESAGQMKQIQNECDDMTKRVLEGPAMAQLRAYVVENLMIGSPAAPLRFRDDGGCDCPPCLTGWRLATQDLSKEDPSKEDSSKEDRPKEDPPGEN